MLVTAHQSFASNQFINTKFDSGHEVPEANEYMFIFYLNYRILFFVFITLTQVNISS